MKIVLIYGESDRNSVRIIVLCGKISWLSLSIQNCIRELMVKLFCETNNRFRKNYRKTKIDGKAKTFAAIANAHQLTYHFSIWFICWKCL